MWSANHEYEERIRAENSAPPAIISPPLYTQPFATPPQYAQPPQPYSQPPPPQQYSQPPPPQPYAQAPPPQQYSQPPYSQPSGPSLQQYQQPQYGQPGHAAYTSMSVSKAQGNGSLQVNYYGAPSGPPISSGTGTAVSPVPPPGGWAPQTMTHAQYTAPPPAAASPVVTGRKRALLIGINYKGMREQLNGCVNDVRFIKHLLCTRFGFQDQNFLILTDEDPRIPGVRREMPTRYNIISAMKWLVTGAQAGDSLFFQFSGHGSQVKDWSGDEVDGYDETILPLDHKKSGQIVDDEMHNIMVKPLPVGVRLTALVDACHSGTGLDLPYTMFCDSRAAEPVPTYTPADRGLISALFGLPGSNNRKRPKKTNQYNGPPVCAGDVFMFSGCEDHQTSADTSGLAGGTSTGAMTYCFVQAIEHGSVSDWRQYTYGSLLQAMRQKLREKRFSQKPQLSSSRPLLSSTPFMI